MHDILKDVLGDNNLVNFPISPVSKNIEVKQIASDMQANKTEKVAPVQPAKQNVTAVPEEPLITEML